MIMFHPKIIVWGIPPLSDKNKLILLLVYPDSIHILSSFFPMKSPCLTRNPPKCEVHVHPAPKLGAKILSSYSCQVFPRDVSDFSSLDPVFFPTFVPASSIASVWRQNFSSASLDRASDHGEWLAWNPFTVFRDQCMELVSNLARLRCCQSTWEPMCGRNSTLVPGEQMLFWEPKHSPSRMCDMYVPNRGGGSCSLFYRYNMVSLTPRVHINCWALTSDPQVYKIRGLTTNLAKLLTIHIMMSMKLGALTHLFKSFETVSKTFPLSSPQKNKRVTGIYMYKHVKTKICCRCKVMKNIEERNGKDMQG